MTEDRSQLYGYSDGRKFEGLGSKETFLRIADGRDWENRESLSGHGSSTEQTRRLVEQLPVLFEKYQIKSVLDLPCGDFNWMEEVVYNCPEVTFIAADIVLDRVLPAERRERLKDRVEFRQLNLLEDQLPSVDLVLCRDCLVHLSLRDIALATNNINASGSRFMLITTFPDEKANKDIVTGGWRPLNFNIPPFCLPAPKELINEGCTEQSGAFADKSLALYAVRG